MKIYSMVYLCNRYSIAIVAVQHINLQPPKPWSSTAVHLFILEVFNAIKGAKDVQKEKDGPEDGKHVQKKKKVGYPFDINFKEG